MKPFGTIVLLLVLALPALSQGKPRAVNLPDVQADLGELSLIDLSSVEADDAEWVSGTLKVLPQYRPGETKPWALAFATNKQGTYVVFGACAKGGKPFAVLCKVTVGAPTPPTPPTPPAPNDPLTQALAYAYATEVDPAKADKLTKLTAVYGQDMVALKATGKVATLGQLQAVMHAAADLAAGAGGLPATRKIASVYIAGRLPATDQPMTDSLWITAGDAYGILAKAAKGVR